MSVQTTNSENEKMKPGLPDLSQPLVHCFACSPSDGITTARNPSYSIAAHITLESHTSNTRLVRHAVYARNMIAATALTTKANGLAKLATSMAIAPLLGASSSPPVLLSPVGSDVEPSVVAADSLEVLLSVGRAMVVFLDMAVPVAALPLAPTPVPMAGTVVVALLSLIVVVVLLATTDWTTTTPPFVVTALEAEDEAEADAVWL
ncbi:MAG: hypothetical protein Q9198_010183 [Flavoplaca austrocitrina]